jgi:hypothetical protein
MKKFAAFLLLFIVMGFTSYRLPAQTKAVTKIAQVKEKAGTVYFTLNSSKPFIFGNNRYILHMGGKEFFRNQQSKKNGKGVLTFMIPAKEYEEIQEGVKMYLSYGNMDVDGEDVDAHAEASSRQWPLGSFTKSLLTR